MKIHRKDGHLMEVMYPQAKECQGSLAKPPEARRGNKEFSLKAVREHGPANILILVLWLLELRL